MFTGTLHLKKAEGVGTNAWYSNINRIDKICVLVNTILTLNSHTIGSATVWIPISDQYRVMANPQICVYTQGIPAFKCKIDESDPGQSNAIKSKASQPKWDVTHLICYTEQHYIELIEVWPALDKHSYMLNPSAVYEMAVFYENK